MKNSKIKIKPVDQMLELEDRVKSLEEQLKRAVADYQNLEKRVSEGRSELSGWATTELVKKFLPVLDHLEKALNGATEADRQSGWFKGVEMAVKQFQELLKSEGLSEIEEAGQFDPLLHEAVDSRTGDNNTILEIVAKGYKIGSKVIRPAQVVVGKESN
ncbi:nucleotide exchange factor GrpE [Candidatus Daviesbacteria bacterium RIFCSPLOWO2_02_FULL_40_8]|uniref:Protein GrpE n=1 Tax=Candidatus Daviesbacteria bacterium RIFCSPLOWO2_01_FULL_40_24 TaxID=1797787 RepID=A0A1F5MJW3_9BACT|nr:MAG: nucleotide exchange factor GrpE [Candidatus Daviesbacteria bacterium RIFCSPHIGHO2_01_FULL_41_45]OGE34359.1 MAG: nucleotide exchange factor GrpE [Candidatus Daviesbacteria bacterium RIFCSPHIGHO2_02_FULL_41_14]OGE65677.1 MAG: nucleotide exchange factor GrpE [Candidatus Daviesbacteria bacterium RIFCSPLOWO2_01_FULL_40_24]OGE66064.1 MAG: nucleotide exchange factor GrpE [Candidatus Daviesbacteria bacterium RIFCSPLOWO2_02_FULL_40_8]